MAEPLKNIYTTEFVHQLVRVWQPLLPNLNEVEFSKAVFKTDWDGLELKQRMSQLAEVTLSALPSNFDLAASIICEMTTIIAEQSTSGLGFEYMFIPEMIAKNGLGHWKSSMRAIECVTQFTSCEFAIRPFILAYEVETMQQMLEWSEHSHANVRRLSSEGCRSRLPWSMALPNFKKDASLIVHILENLKSDDSLFVQKSVANNLNDISKDHPALALQLAKKWKGTSPITNWIVKHGMRTLLKGGNTEALQIFNYAETQKLALSKFQIFTTEVVFGKTLEFQLILENNTNEHLLVRLEYAIYFMKSNGLQNKKVFKISERGLHAFETIKVKKSHTIKPISTRKYYSGKHAVALIVNGVEFEKHDFLLHM